MRIKHLVQRRSDIGQRGDTIVEVLIAIAVVSSVLGITYSIMNKNIQTTRDNQERSEASKLVQGQIELLRALWYDKSESAFDSVTNGAFCMDNLSTKSISNPNNLEIVIPGGYSSECVKQSLYYVSIQKNLASGRSYTVTVKWDSLSGNQGQVVMAYRLK